VNLLIFNLGMDADDSVLGHVTSWTNALARRCEHVSVITMFTGRVAVDDNVTVYSLGKERGWSEPRRLAEFWRLVYRVRRERRIDACFAHMAPLFAVLFAPIARRSRIPVVLWYAHASVTPILRLAHLTSDRCVTATPAGFRIPSDKLFVLGHGIDVDRFRPPAAVDATYAKTALSVGRIAPIKRIDEMVESISVLRERGTDLQLKLFGGPSTAEDRAYERELHARSERLGLDDLVEFAGPLGFPDIASAYHRGGLFLNLSETGAIDKAILESMASGCIPISRNASFQEIARDNGLEWLVPGNGPARVADCIIEAESRLESDRSEVAQRLRRVVSERHSLDGLADAIMLHLTELVELRARGGG
jgi:glycosyltransferase involved in cell wall biosynthesis